jgi:predicted metal-dependent peptidase
MEYKDLKRIMDELVSGSHEKLSDANTDFCLSKTLGFQFYGEFGLSLTWGETKQIPSCAVTVTQSGMHYLWNRRFVEEELRSKEEVYMLLLHEYCHLLWSHLKRTRDGGYDPLASNIAQDAIINTAILEQYTNRIKMPGCGGQTIDPDYNGIRIWEDYYDYLMKKQKEREDKKKKQGGKGAGQPQNGKGGGRNELGETPELAASLDAIEKGEKGGFDVHLGDSVPQEIRDQMVKSVVEGLKARGLVTSDIDSMLGKLRKSRKDYIREIKRKVGELKGEIKNDTYSVPNRRGIWGIKGWKKYIVGFNGILDVSGSMTGEFETALSCVYQDGISINMVQCDTEVKKHCLTKSKRDVARMGIHGGGGTTLQPSIDYIVEKLDVNMPLLLLTDGYCDDLDFTKIRGKVLILTTAQKVKVIGGGSRVKQIQIDKNVTEK